MSLGDFLLRPGPEGRGYVVGLVTVTFTRPAAGRDGAKRSLLRQPPALQGRVVNMAESRRPIRPNGASVASLRHRSASHEVRITERPPGSRTEGPLVYIIRATNDKYRGESTTRTETASRRGP